MDALINDVRFAIRSLAKSKLFTVVALASLALGIGANVTVFSLVNAMAIKPLPFVEPDRLVDLLGVLETDGGGIHARVLESEPYRFNTVLMTVLELASAAKLHTDHTQLLLL